MSFSAHWLALREPADHRARSQALLAEVGAHFAGRDAIRLIDLGCGAGSNLRGTASALPDRQDWLLVDHDPRLIAAARARLAAWADDALHDGQDLLLTKGGKSLRVSFTEADLNHDLDRVLARGADLVTAAALFDLVSAPWIERFVAALAARRLPLYTVLTYDGTETWTPADPADAAMVAAFHAHQATDKGFGPAAGPRATAIMARAFAAAGYAVDEASSPWRLGVDLAALRHQLAEGFAGAVAETGRLPQSTIAEWLSLRRGEGTVEVGHRDLFAQPR